MEKKKYEEFLTKYNIKKNVWYDLNNVEAFILKNGKGIYPDWIHLRFLFTNKNILICHGRTEWYGTKLNKNFSISVGYKDISFSLSNDEKKIINKKPKYPKIGDIFVSTDGVNNILSEGIVVNVITGFNGMVISLSKPVKITQTSKFSFYDPSGRNKYSNHGTIIEGEYTNFIPNKEGKDFLLLKIHEIIKIKDINEIIFK